MPSAFSSRNKSPPTHKNEGETYEAISSNLRHIRHRRPCLWNDTSCSTRRSRRWRRWWWRAWRRRSRSSAQSSVNRPNAGASQNRAQRRRRQPEPHANAATPIRRNANQNVNRNANVNQNANVNRNVNVNQNVNVNRDVDVHGNYYGGGGYYGGGCCYHPVATAAAVTGAAVVTAAVVGSIVNSATVRLRNTNCRRIVLSTVRQHLVPTSVFGRQHNLHRSQSATMI